MKYCKRCVSPDTRPYIKFNDEGICYPCLAVEKQKTIDWKARWNELEKLADQYRGIHGDGYDCIIAASGGKDSWYQTYIMKERLGMNPLIVSIDNYSWTNTGRQNWKKFKEVFSLDPEVKQLNPNTSLSIDKKSFDKYGYVNWCFDRAVYAYPVQRSLELAIPLVVYGEDTNHFYGGPHPEETWDAKKQFTNDVAKPVEWTEWDVDMRTMNPCIIPGDLTWTQPIFLSYFVRWSSKEHADWARTRGFQTLDDTKEWKRDGYLTQYEQIDTVGYATKKWLMFPKMGHQRVTESASVEVREGRMSRDEAVDVVLAEDWKLDRRMLDDFLRYLNITENLFWVKVDGFANRDIVEKRDGNWRLKKDIEKLLVGE